MKYILIILIFLSNLFSDSNIATGIKNNPILSMGISAIIPGGGQFINGEWKKGLVFLGIEILALNQKNKHNKRAKKHVSSYENYATQYWSTEKWLKDFYLYNNPNYEIYKAFVNPGIDGEYCNPSNGNYCGDDNYFDIWDYSHGVDFSYEGNIYSHQNIQSDYISVCQNEIDNGGSCLLFMPEDSNGDGLPEDSDNDGIYDAYVMPWGRLETDNNNNYILDVNGNVIPDFDGLDAIRDHHFHEGLGKYPEFFSGWNDASLAESRLEVRNGYEIPLTDYKVEFQNLRNKSNREFDKEEVMLSVLFLNHAVSMFDAFLSSVYRMKKFNVNSNMIYNRNFNINGLELVVKW